MLEGIEVRLGVASMGPRFFKRGEIVAQSQPNPRQV